MLVAGYDGPESPRLAAVAHACRDVRDALAGSEVVVLVSPHGRASRVHYRLRGDLGALGLGRIGAVADGDEKVVAGVARAWDRPVTDDPVDHGIVVPHALRALPDVPVIATAVVEVTGPDAPGSIAAALDDAAALAGAISSLAKDIDVAVVASAHLGAALEPAAPLTRDERAVALEQEVLAALDEDVAGVADLAGGFAAAGSCGAAPLLVLARLWPGHPLARLAYDAPFGVGYLVGTVT